MKRISSKTKKNNEGPGMVQEDAAVYKTTPKKKLTEKERKILNGLSESVEYVKKYNKGRAKAKSLNQLLNEL